MKLTDVAHDAITRSLDSGALRPAGVRLGRVLRRWADSLDHYGAPKTMNWSFTFEEGRGAVFHHDLRGCRLWYYGDDDYQRAHTEGSQSPWE